MSLLAVADCLRATVKLKIRRGASDSNWVMFFDAHCVDSSIAAAILRRHIYTSGAFCHRCHLLEGFLHTNGDLICNCRFNAFMVLFFCSTDNLTAFSLYNIQEDKKISTSPMSLLINQLYKLQVTH